jgi:hypothetical protein
MNRFRRERGTTRGLSLMEIVIAIVILTIAMMPMMDVFGISGQAVAKSQNLTLAVGVAHKIAQHLLAMPYDEIVDKPRTPLADGPDDGMFNPLINDGSDAAAGRRITQAHLPELHGWLKKFGVGYSLDVVGDQPKDVKIQITWKEGERDLMYTLRVYVSRH